MQLLCGRRAAAERSRHAKIDLKMNDSAGSRQMAMRVRHGLRALSPDGGPVRAFAAGAV